jgi:IS5 family transposase
MLEQKDLDAAWAKKGNELHYGYKNHILCDADSKMVLEYRVTPANVHDSLMMTAIIEDYVRDLWADSAYLSARLLKWFAMYYPDIRLHIHEKATSTSPLTDKQKESNREKSRIRARVEHIFGHMTGSMGGMTIRCIGIERAECAIALKNLAYNLSRYATLRKLNRAPAMS